MSSLAEVLAWKFNNAPGIRTREDGVGGMEIFDWPTAALGSKPTASKITTWTAEYEARPPELDPNEALTASLIALKGTGATVDQVIDVLLGNLGGKGRVAARMV